MLLITRLKIIALFIVATPFFCLAQINFSVKGQVLDTDGYGPSGNIIALNPSDSTLIKGTFFLDGLFELSDLKQSKILLQFSSLEFEDTFLEVEYRNQVQIDLGIIRVQKAGLNLDEVVVKSRRPVYTQKADGTVAVLVENTVLAASNSVQEILSKSPEIVTDETGGMAVFGKGNAILYLNGKRITNNELALISPSNVKKIEIIRNPSAKYDAEGAAVIHITTIQQLDDGYQAKLSQNISHSRFGGTNTLSSANLNFKKGKLSTTANFSMQLGQEREVLYTTRKRSAENVFLDSELTTDWEYDFDNYAYYGVGMQYDLSPKNAFSVAYAGFSESTGGITESNNKIINDFSTNDFQSLIDKDEIDKNHSFSINYNHTIDTLGTNLFIGGQFSTFNIGADNRINEQNFTENTTNARLLKNELQLDIDLFSGQVDFTKVFKNKHTFSVGTKYSVVENDFDFDFLVANTASDFTLDNKISNDIYFKESILAGYLNFDGKLNESVTYSIGVRSEYTDYLLQLGADKNNISTKYINFFPNLSIGKRLSDNQSINFSYTARISRPPYQRLSPVLIYQDPYTSSQGNAELQPQHSHAFEINAKLGETTLKSGYTYYADLFGQAALRGDTPSSYILKFINYDKTHLFFTSASRTFRYKWWTSTNTLSFQYLNIIDGEYGFKRIEPKLRPYFYSNNRFHLSDSFKGELLFWYSGDNIEGLHHRESMYNVTLTLEKSFFDNALKCRLIANDIFHGVIASGRYNVAETDVYYNRRWTTEYFRLAVTYNFGQLKKVNYKNKTIGQSENDRVR